MKQLALLFSGFLLSSFLFTNTSCQKETDCKATVRCIDSTGALVGDAFVLLYAQVKDPSDPTGATTNTADVKATGTTDAGGEVKFTFKLPAIFDIQATAALGTRTITGKSIIKLEEGKTVDKVVTLK
jgi:hypothetical protein